MELLGCLNDGLLQLLLDKAEGRLAIHRFQGLTDLAGLHCHAISISAVQWLRNAEKTCNNPQQQLNVYPESEAQMLILWQSDHRLPSQH